ncbi:MAG TPA: regulatory protein RecX [Acidobacteriaceae bacterium]
MPFKPPKAREPLDAARLYEYAVGALGRRMRTVAELKRLMRQRVEKGETGEARIDAVVLKLQEQKYLDDTAFASYYTRLRQEGAKFGKRRVQQDLQQKGVNGELITTTLDTAYEHVNEEALARQYLEKKRTRKPSDPKESTRVMRQLVRAGFSLGTAFKILKAWNVDESALPAEEPDEL